METTGRSSQFGKSLADMRNAFVLSVDDDRLELMRRTFSASGLGAPTRVEGILTGDHGCSLGHAKMIGIASKMGLKYCVNFEDDAYPCHDIRKKMERISGPVGDIMALGYTRVWLKGGGTWKDGWAIMGRDDNMCGTQALLVPAEAFDKVRGIFEKSAHADDTFRAAARAGLRVAVPKEPLFIQYNAVTSRLNKHLGYDFNGDHENPPAGFPRIEDLLK